MTTEISLAELLAEALGIAAPTEDQKSQLLECMRRAEEAWPGVDERPELFIRHLLTKLPAGEPLETALSHARVADLYLACACAYGNVRAIAALESRYFPDVEAVLTRMRLPAATIDEIKQQLRERLFVGQEGRAPLLGDYAGRGDLRSWLRSVAVNAALRTFRGPKALTLDDAALQALPAAEVDLELSYLKERYAVDFAAAYTAAIQSLEARERNLLRQYFIDGLTIDQLGTLHRIHRATAARRISEISARLFERTRALLMERLRIGETEFESLMRVVRSQLDVSIRGLLGS